MSRKTVHAEPPAAAPHTLDLDFRALEIFIRIADSGGMTQAAQQLGLTQSAVSQTVAGLEAQLGVQLFDRSVRPIALTPAGTLLKTRAEVILREARDAVIAVRQTGQIALPNLNLGMADSVAATIGPSIVARTQGLAAHVSVYAGLVPAHRNEFLSRARDVILSPDALEDEPKLERHPMLREPFVVILPAAYTGPQNSLAAIASALELIRFSARSLIGKQVERHLRRLKLDAAGRIELDTADAMTAMVAAGLGWAITTPLCILQSASHMAGVRCLPLPGPSFSRTITVIARAGELGDIPRQICAFGVDAMRTIALPRLESIAPWLRGAIALGDAAQTVAV
jgi:DNA-binding transcriptional LysR family regulator